MRTFSCFTYVPTGAAPGLSIILAADEARARALARRALVAARDGVVEVHENGKLLWTEAFHVSPNRKRVVARAVLWLAAAAVLLGAAGELVLGRVG